MYAINFDDAANVDFLLQNGADPSIKDSDGRTPFMKAAMDLHHALLGMLLKYGADVSVKDAEDQTAYDLVRRYGTRLERPDDLAKTLDFFTKIGIS